jgi:membrane dipeptidase
MIVDLHAHYPMHLLPPHEADTHGWVLERWPGSAWRSVVLEILSRLFNYQGPGGGPGVTVELMRQGNVGAALSVLYAPFDEMDLHERYGAPPRSRYVESLRRQMQTVEAAVAREAAHGRAQMARNPAALDAAIQAQRVAIVHCIEGGFALGADEAEIAATVGEFARKGVAYVALAHLFYRGVAQNAPALPFMPDPLYKLVFPQKGRSGLTPLGVAAVRAMAEHHVLVDITHMNQRAIDETLQLLGAMPDNPPLIASHIACRLKGGADYNLSEDVIREIGRRGGVIGVIACQHWANDRLPKAKSFEDTVNVICEHIERVRRATNSDDNVAIGSDLDGYIKPALPKLEHEGRMKALNAALAERYGHALAEKFCSGNVLDLLRRYWRGGP